MASKQSRKNLIEVLKYSVSSLLSTFLDYTVYFFVLYILIIPNVNIAFTCARLTSSVENFIVNEFFVFTPRTKGDLWKRFLFYGVLVLIVALVGNGMIYLMHNVFKLGELLSKLITDIIGFIFSYLGQRWFVFPHKKAYQPEINRE